MSIIWVGESISVARGRSSQLVRLKPIIGSFVIIWWFYCNQISRYTTADGARWCVHHLSMRKHWYCQATTNIGSIVVIWWLYCNQISWPTATEGVIWCVHHLSRRKHWCCQGQEQPACQNQHKPPSKAPSSLPWPATIIHSWIESRQKPSSSYNLVHLENLANSSALCILLGFFYFLHSIPLFNFFSSLFSVNSSMFLMIKSIGGQKLNTISRHILKSTLTENVLFALKENRHWSQAGTKKALALFDFKVCFLYFLSLKKYEKADLEAQTGTNQASGCPPTRRLSSFSSASKLCQFSFRYQLSGNFNFNWIFCGNYQSFGN